MGEVDFKGNKKPDLHDSTGQLTMDIRFEGPKVN